MIDQFSIIFFITMCFVAANLPWLLDRSIVFFLKPHKTILFRWLEWFVFYLLCGFLAILFEQKVMGEAFSQGWEFYVVSLCLFVVFALPGFIYFVDLRKVLDER